MDNHQALGEYLRARRAQLAPEDVGIIGGGRRRVRGLRREEVAILAGISADYCIRLEQGRNQTPSSQVLDALAAVLRLDADSTAYLHTLAGPPISARRPVGKTERVPAGTLQFLDALPMPALIHDRRFTVLASNRMGKALSPNNYAGTNLLRAVFLDADERQLHRDWSRVTTDAVAGIRAASAAQFDDGFLEDLVRELSVESEAFRRLWARHDVHLRTGGTSLLDHPEVGPLDLRHEKLTISGTDGQTLVAYHAEPGSPSADALQLLGNLAAAEQR
ncbi:helix-turn-helix transcriptional regulator [Rhodococcus sp. IEGM 1381]|uniref:helix-turn-helix transcriptional regulator n=1 Tax=Rhodococcus sp. IEGM 1381 TaxID=3047085 RepID=UPI0024B67D62|nr:helix-turn-helix transcriptional regulator [Rhodococcus sp. IEGM 1381]MDI9896434.1 helix-turn-helix transcriptional regulator [Rhodococcus sp. IEGM 1381]